MDYMDLDVRCSQKGRLTKSLTPLISSGWFVIAVYGSISVQGTS